jgi:hypothetical protein
MLAFIDGHPSSNPMSYEVSTSDLPSAMQMFFDIGSAGGSRLSAVPFAS